MNAHRGIRRTRQAGFTLIEVLVALLVFSLGVLGMVALQARASTYSVDAEDRTRAALLAADLVSAMWTQHSADLPSDVTNAWNSRLLDAKAGGLPGNPKADVTTDAASGVTTIEITWAEPSRVRQDGRSRYVTQVVIR
jgi:type IV pilus assembly protein PilV